MTHTGPGKAHRKGISLDELMDMFPDEETAHKWFESILWFDGRQCPHCGNRSTRETRQRKPQPYWCGACRKYFSVRTGTALAHSNISLRKWALAIYLCITSLKSVSSMKLHRDIGVTQATAWFMLHRIRQAWGDEIEGDFSGPVEVDETYVGGKRRNMSKSKREQMQGRGSVGKTAVAGIKDRETKQVRAKVVERVDSDTLVPFVEENVESGATVYTDEASAYASLPDDYEHEAVKHSVGEYVRGMAHTNGVESFWSMLKRAHKGTFHKLSPKHLNRYVQEFAGKHNIREMDTLDQMIDTVAGLAGRRLAYSTLVRDNGLSSFARP